MRSWILDESPGDYRFGEIDLADPGPGQVRVSVRASALNHMDLWLRLGQPKPRTPFVPGCDAAGVVDAVGPGVERWKAGDEVVVNPSIACGACELCLADRSVLCPRFGILGEQYWGGHGEAVIVGAANLVARPPRLSWQEAAAYGLCGLTAYRMLRRARLRAGERLLVVGAGGGVATAAIMLGQWMGATVYATSRDADKRRQAVEYGAADAFDSAEPFPIKADVVVDSAGAATWDRSLRALAPEGRLALCGGTAGAEVKLNLPRLFFKQHEIIGSTMGTFREFAELTALMIDGLPVIVDQVYEWDRYPEALARLEAGSQLGKIVLSRD
jgi:zinc-binding alcohol dehydrogenase/oxidoreductase